MALTAKQVAEKWKKNAANAVGDFKIGVQNVTESPMEKAALQADKMKQNIVKAIDDGSWAAGLRSVTLESWKKKTAEEGSNRYSTGVSLAQPQMESFMNYFLPEVEKIKKAVDAMPSLTLQDNISRMVYQVTETAKLNYKR